MYNRLLIPTFAPDRRDAAMATIARPNNKSPMSPIHCTQTGGMLEITTSCINKSFL